MPQVYDPETGKRLITGYIPSTTLAVVGVAFYGVLAAIYWFRLWRQGKKWMLALTISCTTMIVGFILRFPMQNQPDSLGLYIAMTMFILLSPCAFLAQDYVILPRIATWLHAEDCLFLRSRIIVRLFVWSDVITFFLQAAGGGMTAGKTESMANIGHWVMIVGLAIQLMSFGTFAVLAIVFGLRVRSRHPDKWTRNVVTKSASGLTTTTRLSWKEDWRVVYFALLWTAIGIIIRSVFRICEFAQGYDGLLRTTEGWFYGLDALPLWLAIAVYAVIWPPAYLPEDHRPFAGTSALGGYDMQRLGVESPTENGEYYRQVSKA